MRSKAKQPISLPAVKCPRAPRSAARGGRAAGTRQCAHHPQPWAQDRPRPRVDSLTLVSVGLDPLCSWAHRQPTTHSWSLLECAAPGRSSLTRGFRGSPPTTTYSWSLLECAAPGRSLQCGTRGFPGSPPTRNARLDPPGVCCCWPLLAEWDPRFSWACRPPATHSWSLLECAAPGRSLQCGTRGFPGLAAHPQRTLGPSWSVRLLAAPRNVGPRFSWACRPPTTHACSLLECAAPGRSSQCGTRGFPGLTANPQRTLGPLLESVGPGRSLTRGFQG